jgi:branched-chain amino acid transport system permease protein
MEQQAVHGLAVGSIYALLAVGLTFMSGAHRSLFVAYGGLYALGGYVAWWAIRASQPIWLTLGLAAFLCTAVGFGLSWGLHGHRKRLSERSCLLVGLGGLICVEEICRLVAGSYHRKVMATDSYQIHHIGPLMVSDRHWLVFGVTFAILMTLHGFLSTIRLGRTVGTFVQQDANVAVTRGPPRRLELVTCGIGAALGGVSGVLGGLYFNEVYPAMGTMMTHKMIALVLLGAWGKWQGAVLMAFAFAMFEEVGVPALRLQLPADLGLLIGLALVGMLRPRGDRKQGMPGTAEVDSGQAPV